MVSGAPFRGGTATAPDRAYAPPDNALARTRSARQLCMHDGISPIAEAPVPDLSLPACGLPPPSFRIARRLRRCKPRLYLVCQRTVRDGANDLIRRYGVEDGLARNWLMAGPVHDLA